MMEQGEKDIEKMQHDAAQRIRQMQRRSARYIDNSDIPPVPNFVRLAQNDHLDRHIKSKEEAQRNLTPNNKSPNHSPQPIAEKQSSHGLLGKGFDLLKMFNFKNFKIDSDITVIIVLILLLSSEDTDELLLLALAYIML